MKNDNKNSAFSLIELMVVIAIVAVLAAIAVPAYESYILRSKLANVANIGYRLATEAIAFQALNGRFPSVQEMGFTVGGDPTFASNPGSLGSNVTSFWSDAAGYVNNGGYCLGARTSFYLSTNISDANGAYTIEYDIHNTTNGVKTLCYYNWGGGNPSTEDVIPGCINYNGTYNGQLGSDILGNIGSQVTCPY